MAYSRSRTLQYAPNDYCTFFYLLQRKKAFTACQGGTTGEKFLTCLKEPLLPTLHLGDISDGQQYVVVAPKGGALEQCGSFLQKQGYRVRVFNSIDFSKSMHYNPLVYIRNEADILKFVDTLIANTKGDGKKAETLLYCALIAYIIFEGPVEDRNLNTLVDMISRDEQNGSKGKGLIW